MILEELQKLAQGEQPENTQDLFQNNEQSMLLERLTQSLREVASGMESRILEQIAPLVSNLVQEAFSTIQVRDGRPGKDGTPGRDGEPGKDGKDASPVDLEALSKDILAKIPQPRRAGGGGGGDTIIADDLSSQVNGSTRTFTTTKKVGKPLLVVSSQFPTVLRLTTDFLASGTTLTLDSSLDPIASGQTLYFIYSEG